MISHSKPTIEKEDVFAVLKVLKSGFLSLGKKVKELEKECRNFLGVKYAVAVNSGTSALHLSLLVLGIKEDDEVILPSYVCSALLNCVFYVRAKPVLVDINISDFNISFKEVKKKINLRTKAIIVPHMFGQSAEIDKLQELEIPLIEDCAQALGASYYGKKLGGYGDLTILSFYATKVITSGEGGMVLSNKENLIEKIRGLREYDEKRNYQTRYNYKMSELSAALGLSQLKRLPKFIKKRKEIAKTYSQELNNPGIILPQVKENREHIFYRYVIRVKKKREYYIKNLQKNGIECKPPVFKPLHQYLNLNKKDFPETEKANKETLSLPIYPKLKEKEWKYIIKNLNNIKF